MIEPLDFFGAKQFDKSTWNICLDSWVCCALLKAEESKGISKDKEIYVVGEVLLPSNCFSFLTKWEKPAVTSCLPALQLWSWHQAGLLDEVSARGYRTSGGPADTGESWWVSCESSEFHLSSWKDDGFHICLCRHFSTAHVCSGDYFIDIFRLHMFQALFRCLSLPAQANPWMTSQQL